MEESVCLLAVVDRIVGSSCTFFLATWVLLVMDCFLSFLSFYWTSSYSYSILISISDFTVLEGKESTRGDSIWDSLAIEMTESCMRP